MNKIKKIDVILEDEKGFEKYINELDLSDLDSTLDVENLNKSILSKVYKKRKIYYLNICKIAACLVFSLLMCQTDFIKNDSISQREVTARIDISKINDKMTEISQFLTRPINIERNDK